MEKHCIGELRPSQVMFTYGIGAIADLPNLAAIVMGLEEWQRYNTVIVSEDRLLTAVQHNLGHQVKELLSLPIKDEFNPGGNDTNTGLPIAPFPTWMVCPKCDLLAPITSGLFKLDVPYKRATEARYIHNNCGRSPKYPPKVIPVRFLVACEKGHLDDFPWRYFVHKGNNDCSGTLRLIEPSVSGAVTDISVKCDGCGAVRRLSDAFGISSQQNMPTCRGRHPHLRSFDDTCDRQMKTLLLGASNSWFSLSLSALSIPTADNKLDQYVEEAWTRLNKANDPNTLQILLETFQGIGELQEFLGYPLDDIWQAIDRKKMRQTDSLTEETATDLKTPEWQTFSQTSNFTSIGKDWQLKPIPAPTDFQDIIEKVILVEKMREVRALIGFTRIQSPGDFTDTGEVPKEFRAPLSRQKPAWVPAMEVRGEGIFLHFKETALQQWEQRDIIKKQHVEVKEAHKHWLNQRNPDLVDKIPCPDMRYLLLHSFSHALMRQFALECGYNAASLRERIYAKVATPEQQAQSGVLIYTAAPDSEGTLGGLVSLGQERLNYHLHQALESLRICASDPLCSEHTPTDDKVSLHWAACHACLFSPETSCERGNKFLDRSFLIPTLAQDGMNFFNIDG
jgi:hypothetical protein